MNTQQALLKIRAFYVKQRAGKVTPEDGKKLSRWLETNFKGSDMEAIKQLNTTLANQRTTKERIKKERDTFFHARYVRITYLGGGWYSFSPSGHKYFTTYRDDINVHGFENLKRELESRGL